LGKVKVSRAKLGTETVAWAGVHMTIRRLALRRAVSVFSIIDSQY
jgi:hypothetical protein